MRQAKVVEGQRYARRVKQQVGVVEVSLPAQQQLEIPGIPEEHIRVNVSVRQPEALRIKYMNDSRPGHHYDEQRQYDEKMQVLPQRAG